MRASNMMPESAEPRGHRQLSHLPQSQVASLLASHRPALRAFICRRGFTPDDAEDLAQETILRAWCHQASFQGPCLAAWLYRIAANLTVDTVRRRRLRTVPLDLAEQATLLTDEACTASATYELIRDRMADLSPEQREILRLRYEADLSIVEIAGRLRCTDGAAKLRVFRAVEALRQRCGVHR